MHKVLASIFVSFDAKSNGAIGVIYILDLFSGSLVKHPKPPYRILLGETVCTAYRHTGSMFQICSA